MSQTSVSTLIVGAGMSGLAVAQRLESTTPEKSYVVLERDAEIGGYCKTITKDGFVWDYSGHFFHFKHPAIETELIEKMHGQRILKVEKDSRIRWQGAPKDNWIDFPFQKNIHQLPQEDFIDCMHDLYFRGEAFPKEKKIENFKEMLYAKFGKGIAERFLIPYNEKLYATDLSKLDVDAMGRFFPYADIDDVVRNFKQANNQSYNSHFTYPEGGAIQYVNAMAKDVKADSIALNESLQSIDLQKKIVTTNKRTIAYERLVSSMPFPALMRAAGMAFDESIYSYNQVLCFNLGFDRKGPEGVHWAYFPQREYCFYRLGFYDNIFGSSRMSMYVELGFPANETFTEASIEVWKSKVLEDLKKAGIVTDHQLVADHHVVMNPAYVHITQASIKDYAEKKAQLEEQDVHSIGRYGGWTYCSIEDNIVEARGLVDSWK